MLTLPAIRVPTFGPAHIVMAVAALLLALFAYSAVQTAAQSYRLRESQRALEGELMELRHQLAELEGLRSYLASDEYIEAVARQQFGLVRPGEIAVTVEGPQGSAAEQAPGQRWWEALFGR